jgi:hypothetical protein
MNDPTDDDFDLEGDELPPPLSSRIQHLSRKWTDEKDGRVGRVHRRTRRRLEDWRDARALAREFDGEIDRD